MHIRRGVYRLRERGTCRHLGSASFGLCESLRVGRCVVVPVARSLLCILHPSLSFAPLLHFTFHTGFLRSWAGRVEAQTGFSDVLGWSRGLFLQIPQILTNSKNPPPGFVRGPGRVVGSGGGRRLTALDPCTEPTHTRTPLHVLTYVHTHTHSGIMCTCSCTHAHVYVHMCPHGTMCVHVCPTHTLTCAHLAGLEPSPCGAGGGGGSFCGGTFAPAAVSVRTQ